MVGVTDVAVQAKFPNMPLEPMFAYVGSASSVRVRNVPKKIGQWNITNVSFQVEYPDGSLKAANCVLTGGVWVGTVEGCAISGKVEKGYTIYANGVDENGNAVNDPYVLGKGDVEILEADGSITPGDKASRMYYYEYAPENPKEGDVLFIDDVMNIYDGAEWKPVAGEIDKSYIEDSSGNRIYANRTFSHNSNQYAPWYAYQFDDQVFSTPIQMDFKTVTVTNAGHTREVSAWFAEEPYTDSENRDIYLMITENVSLVALCVNDEQSIQQQYIVVGTASITEKTELAIIGGEVPMNFRRDSEYIIETTTLAVVEDVPTKTSDLTNDSDFTTNAALSAGLALKQDKLSNTQVSAINSVVDDKQTFVKFTDNTTATYDIYGSFNGGDWVKNASEIRFGTGVRGIGLNVFYNCTNLTKVQLPDTLEEIWYGAFDGCTGLTDIIIPDSVTYMMGSVFRNCTNLKTVVIGSGVKTIEGGVFDGCTSLESVVINGRSQNQIKNMANYPWGITDTSIIHGTVNVLTSQQMTALDWTVDKYYTFIQFKDPVDEKTYFWEGEINQQTIVDEGLYDPSSFNWLKHLDIVNLGHTVTRIGANTFSDGEFSKMVIPRNVESIGTSAFH